MTSHPVPMRGGRKKRCKINVDFFAWLSCEEGRGAQLEALEKFRLALIEEAYSPSRVFMGGARGREGCYQGGSMTINPCKLHPDAKGDDAPKRELDDEGAYYTACPLCNRAVFGNRRDWNAANHLPEVKP